MRNRIARGLVRAMRDQVQGGRRRRPLPIPPDLSRSMPRRATPGGVLAGLVVGGAVLAILALASALR